jgi:hypothetical protein
MCLSPYVVGMLILTHLDELHDGFFFAGSHDFECCARKFFSVAGINLIAMTKLLCDEFSSLKSSGLFIEIIDDSFFHDTILFPKSHRSSELENIFLTIEKGDDIVWTTFFIKLDAICSCHSYYIPHILYHHNLKPKTDTKRWYFVFS